VRINYIASALDKIKTKVDKKLKLTNAEWTLLAAEGDLRTAVIALTRELITKDYT